MSEINNIRKTVVEGAATMAKAAEQYERDAGIVNEGLRMIGEGIVQVLQGRQMAGSAAETIAEAYTDISFALQGTEKPDPINTLNGIFAALQVMQAQDEHLGRLQPYLRVFNEKNDTTEAPQVMATTASEVGELAERLGIHGLSL